MVRGSSNNNHPSIIIVEVIGFGGGDNSTPGDNPRPQRDDRRSQQYDYNPRDRFQVIGNGADGATKNAIGGRGKEWIVTLRHFHFRSEAALSIGSIRRPDPTAQTPIPGAATLGE
jgi:hypothetical protein